MLIKTKTLKYVYFTAEDKNSLKKWAKEKEISLKEIADYLGYNYKHFIHVIGGRKSISQYAIDKLNAMGWNYEIHE